MRIRAGDVLGHKYRVDRVVGAGGMGLVVAATHVELGGQVAIKILLPEWANRSNVATRFRREARAMVKIQSEHVPRVFDVDVLDDGTPFIVMELLDGSSLQALLREGGPLPVEVAVAYVVQVCDALQQAHETGVVHRDLKPSNLFVTWRSDGSPCVKVLDFGISKVQDDDLAMTTTAGVLGSPSYMSPEQMDSARNVDARTDIWSLGVVLYELLTAVRPFDGDSMPATCLRVTSKSPAAPRALRPEIPAGLEAIILRCLQKDRADRFPSARDFAEALRALGPELTASLSITSAPRSSRDVRPRRALFAAAGIFAAATACFVLWPAPPGAHATATAAAPSTDVVALAASAGPSAPIPMADGDGGVAPVDPPQAKPGSAHPVTRHGSSAVPPRPRRPLFDERKW